MIKKILISMMSILVSTVASADFQMRFSDGSIGAVADGNVRFGDDSEYMLALAGEEGIIMVTAEERSWMRMDAQTMKNMQAQMKAQMEAMMASMPPEQRAMVEESMGSMMAPEVPESTVVRTGTRRTVAGYDCVESEIRDADGDLEEVVCVATPDELGIDEDDFEALAAVMSRISDIMSMSPDAVPQTDFKKLGGLPIDTRDSEYGDEATLVSVETGSIDASLFDIPAGYREVSMMDMMGQ